MIALLTALWWVLLTAQPMSGAAELSEPARPGTEALQAGSPALAQALDGVTAARILADIARLAAPDFNGRLTGTADDLRTGLFVAERFQSLGLQPGGTEALQAGTRALSGADLSGQWAQADAVTVSQIAGQALLDLSSGGTTHSAHAGAEFLPILDSPSVNVTAPVLFVGYGISDPVRAFDEYAGLDARNKVVLFLRGKPEGYAGPSGLAEKIRVAREKGATAFLTVTGPIMTAYESRRGMTGKPMASYGADHLAGAWITPALADVLLSSTGRTLHQIQERLNQSVLPQSVATEATIHLAWERTQTPGRLLNVLGVIPGHDVAARHDTVIIGAHRDHFGRQAGLLFSGADDNASGTAVLLEVARALAESPARPRRTLLFISFSGEEQGLLGSRLYVKRPALSMDRVVAMINVDHAGIGNGRLTVGVAGLPKERAVEAGHRAGLFEQLDLFGFFPGGDHMPFKEAGVPTVTVVSGGPHPHFHQPSDHTDTVLRDIPEKAARYVLALAWLLASAE